MGISAGYIGFCIVALYLRGGMRGNIISYMDMCQNEGVSLQRGMNFRLKGRHSVILMSIRANAPYHDRVEDGGDTLIYEGHDAPKTAKEPNPKLLDQPEFLVSGRLTENGKFYKSAQDYKSGLLPQAEIVRVYEKIKDGIWSDNGLFALVDAWKEQGDERKVFKFKLVALPSDNGERDVVIPPHSNGYVHTRIIPSDVKLKVWKRDGGKCVYCGAADGLHFDHMLPYSKGGTSLSEENVQLLCARHNLEKSAKIQ